MVVGREEHACMRRVCHRVTSLDH